MCHDSRLRTRHDVIYVVVYDNRDTQTSKSSTFDRKPTFFLRAKVCSKNCTEL